MIGEFFSVHYTLCMVIIGTTVLGITCGLLGTFGLLKGYSLCGDAISHAALPGVVGALLVMHTKKQLFLMIGGMITGSLAIFLVYIAQHYTRLKLDTLLGTVLSVFFGLGLIEMTIIQKLPLSHQAIVTTFIFGSAATLMPQDIYYMLLISCIIIMCLICLWKELLLITFDTVFARTVGYRLIVLDGLLMSLLIILIMIGLHTVGAILMSALLIAPAAAARQWTTQVSGMAQGAACVGGISCMLGTCISYYTTHVPTGPIIVVLVTSVAFISLYLAPVRIRVS
jgi:manganese/zinc/iron transport system permease protein